jgi:hypothetical protein
MVMTSWSGATMPQPTTCKKCQGNKKKFLSGEKRKEKRGDMKCNNANYKTTMQCSQNTR